MIVDDQRCYIVDLNNVDSTLMCLRCKFFLLLRLTKLFSSEFLKDSSLMKKSYKNNCEFQGIITKLCTAQ